MAERDVCGKRPFVGVVDASVVIPVYNAGSYLAEQLTALASQDTDLVFEVVIADNGSTDGAVDDARRMAESFSRLVVVDASGRRGPAHARNSGANASEGAVILFCDADDRADPLWVHFLAKAVQRHSYAGGCLEHSLLNGAEALKWRVPMQVRELPKSGRYLYPMSANAGITRPWFDALGGFDEDFPAAAAEEVDLAIRAAKAGLIPYFEGRAVMHYRLRPTKADARLQATTYGAAAIRLIDKHDDFALPTLADDIANYSAQARDALRHLLANGQLLPGDLFRFWNDVEVTRGAAERREYWSLKRRALPAPSPSNHRSGTGRQSRGLATRRFVGRQLQKAAERASHTAAGEPESNIWSLALDLQQRLDVRQRALLGAGLLAGSGVTLEVLRGHRVLYVNPSLDPIVGDVLEKGSYSLSEISAVLAWLRSQTPTGRLILNIGANIGTTALPLAEAGYKVLAVEPVPRAAELLRRNVSANDHDHLISVAQCAVAAAPGALEMVVGENLSISEVRYGHEAASLGSPADNVTVVEVPARPLHEIMALHDVSLGDVALVWSDTEGSERAVIDSGARLWAAGVPLWAEVRPAALRDQGTITNFCQSVVSQFTEFRTADMLTRGDPAQPIDAFRDFVDDVGYGRWDFDNVLLTNAARLSQA